MKGEVWNAGVPRLDECAGRGKQARILRPRSESADFRAALKDFESLSLSNNGPRFDGTPNDATKILPIKDLDPVLGATDHCDPVPHLVPSDLRSKERWHAQRHPATRVRRGPRERKIFREQNGRILTLDTQDVDWTVVGARERRAGEHRQCSG